MSVYHYVKDGNYSILDNLFLSLKCKRVLLVCGKSLGRLNIAQYLEDISKRLEIEMFEFSDFHPNPEYDSVVKGVECFLNNKCDTILVIGGGSAIDVAKCIKLYAYMDHSKNYLNQEIIENNINLIVMPTTSGTGSEATRYAVIYYEGTKQSVSDYSCIPSNVIMDSSVLDTLPIYQKKVTVLDALCHAIESFWSINSNDESKEYAGQAIEIIVANMDLYLKNDSCANEQMLLASNLAGKAINITQTTAGHAMSYKLTSLYGIAHGHAVALCVNQLWPYMINKYELCADERGSKYLSNVFDQLASCFGCDDAMEGYNRFADILSKLDLQIPNATEDELRILASSVNPVRIKNNPVGLDPDVIVCLYRKIVNILDNK